MLFFSPDREPVHRLDLRDYRVNAKEQTVQSENNGNITEFHPQTQRLKYRLNIKFHGKVLLKSIQSFNW